MAFEMMHAEHGFIEREAEAACYRCADQQRAGETGALRVGDGIDVVARHAAFGEDLFEQGNGATDMIARGQFRHDAAVFLMHFYLRVQRMRKQAALRVVQRQACFVTGGFDTENEHGK